MITPRDVPSAWSRARWARWLPAAALLLVTAIPARAQGTFTLMGAAPNAGLPWWSVDTPHFRIVYHEGLEPEARRAARLLETTYAEYRQRFSVTLPRPYHVFLSSRVQIPNAATTPYGYLFLLLNPPRYPILFGNTTGWLDVTIRHELMHAMTFAGSRRPFDRFGLSFGLAVPRDLAEGLAQFYAGEPWTAERGERYLNLLVRSDHASSIDATPEAGGVLYARGFSMIKWLHARHGDEGLRRLVTTTTADGRDTSFGRAFRDLTGMSLRQARKAWRSEVDAFYHARQDAAEPTSSLGTAVPGLSPYRVVAAQELPDGSGLLFTGLADEATADYALHHFDYASRQTRRIAEQNVRDTLSINPSGTRVAYARLHRSREGDSVNDVFVTDLATGRETAVTTDAHALDPVFVGDDTLVYVRQLGLISNLHRQSLRPGSTPEPLTTFEDERYVYDLTVSTDQRRLAAAFMRPSDQMQGLLVMDLETRTITEFLQPAMCRFPLFAPDSSSTLLFTSAVDGMPNVWRLNLPTRQVTAVTRQADSLRVTHWPARDRALAIRQLTEDGETVFVLDPTRTPEVSAPTSSAAPGANVGTGPETMTARGAWRQATPAPLDAFEVPEFSVSAPERFRNRSTFRPWGVIPVPAAIKNRPALGVAVLAADMPGTQTARLDLLAGFGRGWPLNGGLAYANAMTRWTIDLAADARDVTTFNFFGEEDLFEHIRSLSSRASRTWTATGSHVARRVSLRAELADSRVLDRDGATAVTPQSVLRPEATNYRVWRAGGDYRVTRIRPAQVFAVDAVGALMSYQYTRSLSDRPFDFHDLGGRVYALKPVRGTPLRVLSLAALDLQTGAAPGQLRPGLARYSSGNSVANFSNQVQIRGSNQYLPGSRQLTSTTELRWPLGRAFEPIAFADVVVATASAFAGIEGTSSRGSVGVGLRLAPVAGISPELGWARLMSTRPLREGTTFYVRIGRELPF